MTEYEDDDYIDDNLSLKEQIRRINEKVDKEKNVKKKNFRLPFSGKLSKGKVKQGYATVLYINENKSIKFLKKKIEEGAYSHDKQPYVGTTNYSMSYKGKPFIIQPCWSIVPFNPEKDMDDAVREKRIAVGYRLLLNMMMKEAISDKKKMAGGMIILVIALIVVAIYLFKGGGPVGG